MRHPGIVSILALLFGLAACGDDGGNESPAPRCGDGSVDAGEACDDGPANSDTAPDACRTDCTLARCGDGVKDAAEGCDDGNEEDGDACLGTCVSATCGDGVVQTEVETCDDGEANSDSAADACRTTCIEARCGDAVEDTGEACDDGNEVDTDACTSACEEARCGDGFLQDGEACDDGNDVDEDSCTSVCEEARCGDGFLHDGETCDDGNDVDEDSCTTLCEEARCGDGFLHDGETCDDGNDVDEDSCTTLCEEARCGDGFVQDGEVCDDGNVSNTDSCLDSCVAASCGDGFLYAAGGEQCDDGPLNADQPDACRTSCQIPVCGDAIPDSGEACDDGDEDDTDACTSICEVARCGDGFVQEGEVCDDGNADDADACTSICEVARCGDGFVQEGETCDDGNVDDTDACTSICEEARCGDGFVQEGETCDDGNDVNEDECTTACVAAACGDGFLQDGEDCDDGNIDAGDGCSDVCLVEEEVLPGPGELLTLSGNLDGQEDTFERLDQDWLATGVGCIPVDFPESTPYETWSLVNDSGAAQTIVVEGRWMGPFGPDDFLDGALHLYRDSFDAADPSANCITVDEDYDWDVDFGDNFEFNDLYDGSRTVPVTIEDGETLIILVTTYDGASIVGDYDLVVENVGDPVSEVEDNGEAEFATSIDLVSIVTGAIEADDEDWFSFDAEEGKNYRFEASPESLTSCEDNGISQPGTLEVYDSNGVDVLVDGTDLSDNFTAPCYGAVWTAPATDTYYVRFYQADGDTVDTYYLMVRELP